MNKIKVGILGYGNIGRGVEAVISKETDMELVAIFTRRNPDEINTISNVKAYNVNSIENFIDEIDVLILCSGSATDLPVQGPTYAKMFNTVDSFDTHAKIYEYFEKINNSCIEGKKVSLISTGWDPGLFSLNRLLFESILKNGKSNTFWGKGVSQGHSDAIRRIDGVKNAIQYTIPNEEIVYKVKEGNIEDFKNNEKHIRECFVVSEDYANKEEIERQIKTMPNYFNEYKTIVHFITEDEFEKNHRKMSHGGFVFRTGITGDYNNHYMEFSIKLDSNPEFTASVLIACTRAVYRLSKENIIGAKTICDIPMAYLTSMSQEEILKNIL